MKARGSEVAAVAVVAAIGTALVVGLAILLTSCAGAPKPCPIALEAQYTAELVEACADAGSVAACPGAEAVRKAHHARQVAVGCRK